MAHPADSFRALRADIDASVLPWATSIDGRRFSFQSGLTGLALRLGGYLMLEGEGERSLAQVRSLAAVQVDLGKVALAAGQDQEADVGSRVVSGDVGAGDVGAGWARSG